MNEEPKVSMAQDDGAKNQWGKSWLFSREGGKWRLNTKKTAIAMGFAFIALTVIQLVYDTSPAPTAGAVASSPNISPADMVSVMPAKLSDLKEAEARAHSSSKKGGAAAIKYSGPQVVGRPRDLRKIPPGTMVKARLSSGGSNGLVRAELTESVSVNGDTLLPAGTVLLGTGNSTEERLFISFNQAVFQDGAFAPLAAQACDLSDKIVGLKGSMLGNKALNLAGSVGLGFVGGFSEGLQDSQGQQGVLVRQPSLKNALLNATATTALEQSKNLTSDLKNRTPIIEVPAGTEIFILVSGQN